MSLGVDVNTVNHSDDDQDADGEQSALMIACKNGHSAIVSRLIEVEGLDINYEDELGYNAANLACYNGSTECVDILVQTDKVDWNKVDKKGRNPLFSAVESLVDYQHIGLEELKTIVETLARLEKEKFDGWNIPDEDGNTLIMFAMKNCFYSDTVGILLTCPRFDPSCRDTEGWSLVFRSIQRGDIGE